MTLRLCAFFLAAAALPAAPLTVVPSVDLVRYAGKWYEIARLPAWFQRACQSDTTATYTLRPDGKITVLNECRQADGRMKAARGTAKLASASGPNTKLRVTFFWPFYGDYWIIDLDPDYRWAVVGEPGRKYFWILARQPQLDESTLNAILERARQQGYDLSPLIRTSQTR
jgi:apolipoprotein D and lipocalin family protein